MISGATPLALGLSWPFSGPLSTSQMRPPTCLATVCRIPSVTCWYRAAMPEPDHPMGLPARTVAESLRAALEEAGARLPLEAQAIPEFGS